MLYTPPQYIPGNWNWHMSHTIRDKKPLLARVRRIRGQVQALEALLEETGECAAV